MITSRVLGILIYDGITRSNSTLIWKRGGWHINTHEFPNGDKPHDGGRFFVEAIREELDAEWEWFLDVKARTVELVAPAGLDMETANVVAPTIAQPFEYVGARDVHITGLNITHTAAQYMLPYDNPSRGDWCDQSLLAIDQQKQSCLSISFLAVCDVYGT